MRHEVFPSLFTSLAPSDFMSKYWNRRALYTAGAAWRSHVRFTLEELVRELPSLSGVRAQYFRDGRHQELEIEGGQAVALHDAGLTICASAIDQHLPGLAEFTMRLRDEVRFAGDVMVNCYWSPAGGGFGTHFDDHHVFILQVDGSKRWWISQQPACAAPPENLVHAPELETSWLARHPALSFTPPDEASFVEHLLRPGDCLYLPPGTWHRTAAGDFSLALTLALRGVRPGSIVSSVALRWFERSVKWREGLPMDAAPAVGLTPAWRDYLDARIAEFREFAAKLTPEMLAEEWLAATVGRAVRDAAPEPPRVADDDLLLRERRLEICAAKGPDGGDVVVLLWTGGRCEIPGDHAFFCRRLAATTRFTLAEARRWTEDGAPLGAEETREVLQELLRTGLLRRA